MNLLTKVIGLIDQLEGRRPACSNDERFLELIAQSGNRQLCDELDGSWGGWFIFLPMACTYKDEENLTV